MSETDTPRSDEAGRVAMAVVATGPTSLTTFADGCKVVLEKSRQLEREIDALKHDIERYLAICSGQATELTQAQARCAELEKEHVGLCPKLYSTDHCDKHRGQSFMMAVASAPSLQQVCPICEQAALKEPR